MYPMDELAAEIEAANWPIKADIKFGNASPRGCIFHYESPDGETVSVTAFGNKKYVHRPENEGCERLLQKYFRK